MMKRIGVWLVFLLLLVAVWGYFSRGVTRSDQKLPTVSVARGDIELLVSATGSLQPDDYVDVGAQVSGQLVELAVEVGDVVNKGDFLAAIDAAVLQTRVDAARASLAVLRAQRKEREAVLKLARSQSAREERLFKQDASSVDKVEQSRMELVRAQAQLGMVDAQIAETESNLHADQVNLDYTKIYAPMAGTVVSVEARRGQTLNANQMTPVLMRIADLHTMTVQAAVSEADIPLLEKGMPARFSILGGQGRLWQGQLRKIEPTPVVENNVVLYNVLFDVDNTDEALMTQMTAQVFFVVKAVTDALLVPLDAVQFEHNADDVQGEREGWVQVLLASGEVERRAVRTGISNRVQIQILSGLTAGESVVLQMAAKSEHSMAKRIGRRAAMKAGMRR